MLIPPMCRFVPAALCLLTTGAALSAALAADPIETGRASDGAARFGAMRGGMRGDLGGMASFLVGSLYDYEHAATSGDVSKIVGDYDEYSRIMSVGSIGTTNQGREIAISVIADPPVAFDADGPAPGTIGDRLVVLLFGSIHAGELCGTDALLRTIHDFVGHHRGGSDMLPLLKDLVVCIVPVYNADGHADFGPDHRPGQNGPAEVGQRHNAQGLDLNRDWLKMDAPETRAMVGFLNAWDPAVIVDTHTTNGSNHRFTLTYQGPKHPAGDSEVLGYVRDTMLPAVDASFEAMSGYDTFFYGNFAEKHTKWTTYPAEPWYGVAYRGIRNRVSILTEAYAYASFEDRVLSTQAFCEEVLRYSAAHKAEIRALIDAADARTVGLGKAGAPVATKTEAAAFETPVEILGFDEPEESGAHSQRAKIDLETAAHRAYSVPMFNDFVATQVVDRPAAYVVPAAFTEVIDRLRAHGVAHETATAGGEFGAGVYRIESVERAEREWQNRRMMELGVALERGAVEIQAGDVIVPTAQPLGSLAAYMLEPTATGGLAAWGFFDGLSVGGAYPIARIDARALQALSLESTSSDEIPAPTSEMSPEEPE